MKYAKQQPSVRRRRPRRGEEGAVMLIVMLILLTATTLAATSLQTTQFELRSSGYNRAAVQTQYVSEAAAVTTTAWVDATSLDRSFLRHLQLWNLSPEAPSMAVFGEPDLLASTRQNSNRTQWEQQKFLSQVGIPPITQAGYADTVNNFTDPIGTFGPRSAYRAGIQPSTGSATDYVVDMYDCRQLPNTAAVGYQINQGGSGVIKQVQYYCVITSRGRAYVPYPGGTTTRPTKSWTIPNGSGAYVVNRFTMAHDARGTIVTPPIIQQ